MIERRRREGFTLLEVLIAMSILAVGATSILSLFVAATRFHVDRVENNRITQLLNHARNHAQIAFNNFDPDRASKNPNPPSVPGKIVADLTDRGTARSSPDPMIREAAERFPGFKYEITFEDNSLATVPGSSVVATIHIYRMNGKLDHSMPFDKVVLTRDGTPVNEFFKSPSLEARDRNRTRDVGRRKGG